MITKEYYEKHIEWSKSTFGEGHRTKGIVEHIGKELKEILADPLDTTEWIDVAILALDGAWRTGKNAEEVFQCLYDKMELIKTRTYPKPTSEDVAVCHVKSFGDNYRFKRGDHVILYGMKDSLVWQVDGVEDPDTNGKYYNISCNGCNNGGAYESEMTLTDLPISTIKI